MKPNRMKDITLLSTEDVRRMSIDPSCPLQELARRELQDRRLAKTPITDPSNRGVGVVVL